MPLVETGPPLWTWERPEGSLKWDLLCEPCGPGQRSYALKLQCGLEVFRLQGLERDDLAALNAQLAIALADSESTQNERLLDESLKESFPASDPPAWTASTGVGAPATP